LALLGLARIGPIEKLPRTNSLEDVVEVRLADQKGVVLAGNLSIGIHVVQVRSVIGLDHHERSPSGGSGKTKHLGEKRCGRLAVMGGQDGVIELDSH
jgi:hypothetical protein